MLYISLLRKVTRQIVLSDLYKEKYCTSLQYFFNELFNDFIFYLNLFHNITVLVTMWLCLCSFFLCAPMNNLQLFLAFMLVFFICWWENVSEDTIIYNKNMNMHLSV